MPPQSFECICQLLALMPGNVSLRSFPTRGFVASGRLFHCHRDTSKTIWSDSESTHILLLDARSSPCLGLAWALPGRWHLVRHRRPCHSRPDFMPSHPGVGSQGTPCIPSKPSSFNISLVVPLLLTVLTLRSPDEVPMCASPDASRIPRHLPLCIGCPPCQ